MYKWQFIYVWMKDKNQHSEQYDKLCRKKKKKVKSVFRILKLEHGIQKPKGGNKAFRNQRGNRAFRNQRGC